MSAGYEGPTPTFHNNYSAVTHKADVAAYILKELEEGAMLGPFDFPPFYPSTQTNPLLTRPKRDSHLRRVIMDLSWPAPPVSVSMAARQPTLFLVSPKKCIFLQPPIYVI